MQIFTTTLSSGELALESSKGAMSISIEPSANSSCTITGSIPFKGIQPTPIVLMEKVVVNYAAASASAPLNGITITWVSGAIDIIIGF